ncbi:anthranilate synthase component I [Helicobacter didelphidarum]|uniref:Anthranilate synthase component 1 n=2 Tax=Helicobacter didelphidarum TaxID=2040648 RepID=A0A3D8IGC2_9HELI|nr:anthranilate synthase component I [Helicobacter didelphidarum]
MSANMHTPLALYKGLNARFLLESASLESGRGRYSIIVRKINFSLIKNIIDSEVSYIFNLELDNIAEQYNLTNLTQYKKLPKVLQTIIPNMQQIQEDYKLDFLSLAEKLRECYPQIPQELSNIPLPLGGLGYIGYEFFSECEHITFSKPMLYNAPEALLVFPQECIVFDHFYDEMYLVVSGYHGHDFSVKDRLESLKLEIQKIGNIKTIKIIESDSLPNHNHSLLENNHDNRMSERDCQDTIQDSIMTSEIIYEDSQEWYEKHVEIIRDEIYKGTFLQCVLSCSIVIKSNLNPLFFYETLRRNNPSPYMYYLDFGQFKIIGASPEVMLQCKQNIQIVRPIAGTRKRGKTLQEDESLAQELLHDAKENAEHLMLVDLGRNDIGKNAKIGSVSLHAFRIIEKYSSVMHIVSEVRGEIAEDKSVKDCLKSCFPAGTISGAPKIEAINKLNEYETHGRGIYSGAILYFTRNGDLDSAITLRSAVFQDGNYYLQAGAGIVIDSNPYQEYLETCNKMKALYDILMQDDINS